MRIRLLSLCAVLGVIALVVAACGVPKSSRFQPIPLGNIPNGLTETTTTTTTTTILETTSTVEPLSTTTTIAPVPTTNPTEPATLYFVAGQQLTSAVQFLPRPVQVQVALAALQAGPDNVVGLRTAIAKGSTLRPTKYRGVWTIDLNPDFFSRMSDPADERLAIGQIVETLAGLKGVGLIRFTINDEPIAVPLGNGVLSEPGAQLATEDYDILLGTSPPPGSTTTVLETTTPEATSTTTAATG